MSELKIEVGKWCETAEEFKQAAKRIWEGE